ncbi:hypothetical protein V6N13_059290 [Hibiscus sabdariffa]
MYPMKHTTPQFSFHVDGDCDGEKKVKAEGRKQTRVMAIVGSSNVATSDDSGGEGQRHNLCTRYGPLDRSRLSRCRCPLNEQLISSIGVDL